MTVLLFPFARGEVAEGGVDAVGVVPVDPSEDRSAGFGSGREDASLEAFAFERVPERFGDGVVPAHSGSADRWPHLAIEAEVEVVVGGVLTSATGLGNVLVKRLSEKGVVFEKPSEIR